MDRMTLIAAALVACSLPACTTEPSEELAPCEGKCDGASSTLDPRHPDEAAVQRLLADAGRDGSIDEAEAWGLATFTKAAGGQNARITQALAAIVANDNRLTASARTLLEQAISGTRPGDVPLDNAVYRLVLGPSPFLEDDTLYLVGDGRVEADTGLRSHSRGYAAKRDGVLFTRHGSLAPPHVTLADDELRTLRATTPDVALDRAAVLGGVQLSQFATFEATAHARAFYDPSPSTPYWAGICQGWTHNALDNRLSLLVDAPGNEGQRGLWIFGQWISRADLGNQMMGASYSLGIADSTTIDSLVTPRKLLVALGQHVLGSGVGLRVDIWSDEHNDTGGYSPQIWNQPIVAASIEVAAVSPATRVAVLARATSDTSTSVPVPPDADVKRVQATATWGVEAGDAWEREPAFQSSEWNIYAITDAGGRVLRAYMAFDIPSAQALPIVTSDGLPDYMAIPKHTLTDASLSGAAHPLLDPSNVEGTRYKFLVGTVLARGIPDATRSAFEAEALSPGADRDQLAARYPGIANAYSPEQWAKHFEPALGAATSFGAVWAR